MVKNLQAKWETQIRHLGWEDPLKEGMATLSSILPEETHGQNSLEGAGGFFTAVPPRKPLHQSVLLYKGNIFKTIEKHRE